MANIAQARPALRAAWRRWVHTPSTRPEEQDDVAFRLRKASPSKTAIKKAKGAIAAEYGFTEISLHKTTTI